MSESKTENNKSLKKLFNSLKQTTKSSREEFKKTPILELISTDPNSADYLYQTGSLSPEESRLYYKFKKDEADKILQDENEVFGYEEYEEYGKATKVHNNNESNAGVTRGSDEEEEEFNFGDLFGIDESDINDEADQDSEDTSSRPYKDNGQNIVEKATNKTAEANAETMNNYFQNERKQVTMQLLEDFDLLNKSEDNPDTASRKMFDSEVSGKISKMNVEEFVFFKNLCRTIHDEGDDGINSYYRLTDGALDYLSINRPSFVYNMPKDGSELKIMRKNESGNVSFVNEVDRSSYTVWKEATKIVPTAPIITNSRQNEKTERVFSRYSGMTLGQIKQLGSVLGSDKSQEYQDLVSQLENQKIAIEDQLDKSGIIHGHMHGNNYTVEYIPKSIFTDGKDYTDPNIINNLAPEEARSIIFDTGEYLKNTKDYYPCLRLIDWDRAKKVDKEKKTLKNIFLDK
jgi:hypothetical protein